MVSFEPAPRNVRYFRQHRRLNQVCNCIAIEAAVRRRGGSRFDVAENHASGCLTTDGDGIMVRVVALDELFAADKLALPNLIKMDMEGDALLEAATILARYKSTIFLSTHNPTVHRDSNQMQRQFVALCQ